MLSKTDKPKVLVGSLPLQNALQPLAQWLLEDGVIEICVNKPHSVFIERIGASAMEHCHVEELTEGAIAHIAERVAGATKQSVNSENPILSATLPDGSRFQAVLPPAAPDGGSLNIRKQVIQNISLQDYVDRKSFSRTLYRYKNIIIPDDTEINVDENLLLGHLKNGNFPQFLNDAVLLKKTIILSGGTSTGKTTFLNMLLGLVPSHERLVTIEDVSELTPKQENSVSMLASKGDQGAATVTIQNLLESSLRMRPDRILLGEIRGEEAFTFLRAVNTGHPGSITTVHADSTEMAFHQMVLMSLQAATNFSAENIMSYVKNVVPIVIQLKRWEDRETKTDFRGVDDIYYSPAEKLKLEQKYD